VDDPSSSSSVDQQAIVISTSVSGADSPSSSASPTPHFNAHYFLL
jgi:hypothetical protein